jgi:hypothetical protein
MCTENHVCFGRIHGSQLREGAYTCTTYVRTYVRAMVHVYHWYVLHVYVRMYVRTYVYDGHTGSSGRPIAFCCCTGTCVRIAKMVLKS